MRIRALLTPILALALPACFPAGTIVIDEDPATTNPDDRPGSDDTGEDDDNFLDVVPDKPDFTWPGWFGDDDEEDDTGDPDPDPEVVTLLNSEWWNLVEIDDSTAKLMPHLTISDCEDAAPYHGFDWGVEGSYDHSLSQIECIGVGFKFNLDESFEDRGTVDVAFTSMALDTDTNTWVTVTTEIPDYWSFVTESEADEFAPAVYELAQIRAYNGDEVASDCCVSEWTDVQPDEDVTDVYLVETDAEDDWQAQDFMVY